MNPKQKLKTIQDELLALKATVEREGRDFTANEASLIEAKAEEATRLKAAIARAEKSQALMDRIAGKAGSEPIGTGTGTLDGRGNGWAKKAVENLSTLAGRNPDGVKSLTTGTVSVPAILSPVTIDDRPRTLLDLIPVADTAPRGGTAVADDDHVGVVGRPSSEPGNVFSFIRQTLRTNNAGAVPDGAEKPTSIYTFGQVNDTFRVYANKTEYLHWRFLRDFGNLVDVVSAQLRDDTLAAIERDVIAGDGEEDRFLGILETSGVQLQPFTTDLLTTLSAAKYKLLAQERNLTGWALNPLDLQALEMLRENGSTGAFLFKSRVDIEGFLGAPVVTSLGLPTGTALAADWKQAELLPLGDDELVFDGQKRTENNTFRLMFEGRYGFRVKKPFDFVKVELTES
jgi:HK97 family phage major capsid protein